MVADYTESGQVVGELAVFFRAPRVQIFCSRSEAEIVSAAWGTARHVVVCP